MLEQNNYDQLDEDFTSERQAHGPGRKRRSKQNQDQKMKKKESIRIRLFKIYYQITKERNTGKLQGFFLIAIFFIQIYDLIISPLQNLPFNGALYNAVSDIADVIRIYPSVIQNGDTTTYWFFMDQFFVISTLYILLLVLADYLLRNKRYQLNWPFRVLQNLSLQILWTMVIPGTDFLISIFECDSHGLHFLDKSLVCWSTRHSFLCALYSLGLFCFCCISVLISLLFNESRPYHTDALTRLDTNGELYGTLYRIIITVVSHYTTSQNYQWLVLALHSLVSIYFIRNYTRHIPFYYEEISIFYGAMCLGYCWVAGNGILVKALDGIEYRGQIIVILVGFLFLYPCCNYVRSNKIRKILMLKSLEKIKNDLELDQFATNFQSLLLEQERNKEVEIQFLGFLFLHKEECQSTSCPLKSQDHLYLPLSDSTSKRDQFPSHDKIVHQHLLNSAFLEYQRSHPNTLTSLMHTSYANFLFYQMGNVHMALIELALASKCSTTLQQSFTIFRTKNIIEEYLVKKFRSGTRSGNQIIGHNLSLQAYSELDVTIVITFESLFNRLEKQIEQSATDHIEFWSHLDSNMIDLNVINKLGLNIINQTKKVNEIWNQLIKINPNYPNALYIYGNYLSQIKNDIEQGDEFKNHYHQVKRLKSLDDYENQFDLMFAEDTTVIIMNGNREQQGKIIKTNQGIFKLFGYSMFEVQGHDVNILMPPVIAIKHQTFLDKYFKTGKERIINNCLETFAMYRTGIIFPIHLVVKTVPSLRNDIQYIAMIKRSSRDYEYIITDENGKIDSISEGITSLLKLPISFFKDHDIPIQVLAPELCEVSRFKASGGESITNFEAWNGLRDLRFMVPKNFSSSTGRGGGGNTSTSMKMDATSGDIESGTGTGTGTGTHTQTSSSSKNMKQMALTPGMQQTFIGLRSTDSLKIISNMFKNAEHKAQPEKYQTNLLNHVNYKNADFDKLIKTDVQLREYSDGDLKLKVFKIFYQKKKKNQLGGGLGGRKNSDASSQNMNGNNKDEETMLHKFGFSGMSALNDKYVFQKYKELLSNAKSMDKNFNFKSIQHDIEVLKVLLDRQKKVRTHGNIMTPTEYENAELERMKKNIEILEQQIGDMQTETSKNSRGQNNYYQLSQNLNQSSVNMIQNGPGGTGGGNGTENSSLGIRGGTNQSFQNQNILKGSNGNTEDDNTANSNNPSRVAFGGMFGGPQNNFSVNNNNNSSNVNNQSSEVKKGSHNSPGFNKGLNQDFPHPTAKNLIGNDKRAVTTNDEKTGYDEDLDEEDSKSDLNAKKKKKDKKKNKTKQAGFLTVEGATETEDAATANKSRKPGKEDPRMDFVNDFFKQNLNPGTLNPNMTSNNTAKREMSSSKIKDPHKNTFMTEWQNEILRNLQDTSKQKKQQKDHTTGQIKDKSGGDKSSGIEVTAKGENTAGSGSEVSAESAKDFNNEASSIKMNLESDTGSVTSDSKILIRHLRLLRNAVYENYSPQSIQNLKYSARFVLVVLLSMTIASFILSKQKYDNLKDNFHNISDSQNRMKAITTINTATRFSCLINNGTVNRYRYGPGQDYLAKMKNDLNTNADLMQQSQRNLSQVTYDFDDQYIDMINKRQIQLYYNVLPDLGNTQIVNIWSTTQQLAVQAYKIKDYSLTQFTLPKTVNTTDFTSDMGIWFILRNSMNNILSAVQNSTTGILNDTSTLSDQNRQILLILLIVASGSLVGSMFIIMPVVTRVHQDKDKLLSLFLQIDQNDVKEQLKRCKEFFTTFHNDEKGGSGQQGDGGGFDFDEDNKDGEDGDGKKDGKDGKTPSSDEMHKNQDQHQKQDGHRNRFTRKNKKLKKYSTNYVVLLFKFFVFIALLESYFLYQYFRSDNFLQKSLSMITEAATITDRSFSNFLLFQIIIEILATNGTAQILNQQSTDYIVNYVDQFNTDLEDFLQVHSNNVGIHDSDFNTFFNNLVYTSVCDNIADQLTAAQNTECSTYLGGILDKGLYSANLAFWDDMREIRDSFFKSNRSSSYLSSVINSNEVVSDERLNEIYFQTAYYALINRLNDSINVQFNARSQEMAIVFAFYIVILILLFFLLWGRFVESMRHSLWVTKSMLAIIPLEVIEKVKVIKDFLMSTSRVTINSMKD